MANVKAKEGMVMRKLKAKEIADYRAQQLAEQKCKCALCNEPIEPGKAVLDHDHKTGQIRAVLHRGCNALLGHIENNAARNFITQSRLRAICENLIAYQDNLQEVLHPTHRTPEEKKELQRKRNARKKKNKGL